MRLEACLGMALDKGTSITVLCQLRGFRVCLLEGLICKGTGLFEAFNERIPMSPFIFNEKNISLIVFHFQMFFTSHSHESHFMSPRNVECLVCYFHRT